MYKDDLKELVDVLEKAQQEFEITADGYKLANITEIDNISKPWIREFSIVVHQWYRQETPTRLETLNLQLGYEILGPNIYLSDDSDTHLLGLLSRLDSIVSKRKSKIRFLVSYWTIIIGSIFLSFLASILTNLIGQQLYPHPIQPVTYVYIIWALDIVLITLWNIWVYYMKTKRHVIIYLTDFHSRPRFLRRNRDVILLILGIVLSGLVSLIVAKLTTSGH